jgi:hypothetical protein
VSFSKSLQSLPHRFLLVAASFLQKPGLPFGDVLSEEKIQAAFEAENANFAQEEEQVYSTQVTLWAFLSQVLFKGEQRSCQAAVDRVATFLAASGKVVSGNTGAYCRARAKLPESVLQRLTLDSAEGCEKVLPQEWLWLGHHVYLVDGSTASMPDTPDNQEEWPQHGAQQKGLGFPIVRFVVLLSLATAMARGLAMGRYMGKETGETALFRELLNQLRAGDVVLADRYYCSYFMVALLLELGVHVVMRLHQQRPADFRRGQRLAKGDHIVHWMRPAQPEWMDDETYSRMPESLAIREMEVHVAEPGFRTQSLVIITTLTDAERYPKDALTQLYRQRWLAELDIRAIKITLGMDVLRCQTPHMVRREIWTCLLAYNSIRQTMLAAAQLGSLAARVEHHGRHAKDCGWLGAGAVVGRSIPGAAHRSASLRPGAASGGRSSEPR